MHGRTVHSLAQARRCSTASFTLSPPKRWPCPDYICEQLDAHGIEYQLAASIENGAELDILYMTRVQKERFDETEFQHLKSKYKLDASMLEGAKPNLKVLHPLPRIDEIATDVDATPHAYYFQQAQNGVFARGTLLALVLNETV